MTQSVQILGISNAIVDVLAHVDKEFLDSIGAPLGSMTLIDEKQAHDIYSRMGPATEMSGGSVANTIAGFANLGGSASYIGKVRDDQLGEIFNHDMRSLGVDIRLEPATDGAPTARSHVLISEGGQRTMQTYLGACLGLALADITESTVGSPKALLLEGYVWDIEEGPALAKKAAEIARRNGTSVSISLSDSFCVDRHRDSFMDFVQNDADIVVADEEEIYALLGTDNIETAIRELAAYEALFAVTRSEKGSVIIYGDTIVEQDAAGIKNVVDTTGAGDAYAAGFLYGWATDRSLSDCARYGTYCATKVIQQVGARIEKGLLDNFS
jgi:sugar/nucleoside kinase (ribokinase family)